MREHVEAGSALYTDALKSYIGLDAEYEHEVVDHAVEYVDGKVHTNTMENFWSLVKAWSEWNLRSRGTVPSCFATSMNRCSVSIIAKALMMLADSIWSYRN